MRDSAHVRADSSRVRAVDTVKVMGRIDNLIGTAQSASEGHVGYAELHARPITREGELLESVPGLIVTQHSGEGKANQYFLRGFNLDHGTDFQTRVEGMPINMASHAHGQGWTDLNFLVPELVDNIDYKLGVYHAEIGDFGSAGGAEFRLAKRLDHPFTSIGFGDNGLRRVATGGSTKVGAGDLLIGGEVKHYDGPWQLKEDIRKFSGLARYSWNHGASTYSLLALGYRNHWNSNDQIPLRAVQQGLITRFGQIDTTDGGRSERYSLSASWRHLGASSLQDVQVYGVYSYLSLYSDFGYQLDQPSRGDQFNQIDRRNIVGVNVTHTQAVVTGAITHVVKVGLQSRADFINGSGLYHTEARARFETVRQDVIRETGTGVFAELESHWTPWFRSVLSSRADEYTFHVASDRPENSGAKNSGIVSPKASFVFTLPQQAELYASGGFGFHSNDARGATITVDPVTGNPALPVNPLVRSRGAELGLRASPIANVRSTLSLWVLNLDSELLFTGDGGATEPAAASGRRGITFANFYRPTPSLSVDADISFAHAEFRGVARAENHIPGALENVFAGGVTWTPPGAGVFSAIRLRHFGAYSLIEDNSTRAQPSTLVNADVGYRLSRGPSLQLTMLNVLNAKADDIQYFYTSRLKGEGPDGVPDIHFHPVEPRQLRVSLEWKF